MTKAKLPWIVSIRTTGPMYDTRFWTLFVSILIIIGISVHGIARKINQEPIPRSVVRVEKKKLLQKDIVKFNLNKGLKKYNKRWQRSTINWVSQVLVLGERETKIRHQDILAIISIESEFNPLAKNHNKNGTWDFSLTQTNSNNRKDGFRQAARILKRNKVWFSSQRNKYDMALNIIYAFNYLKWSKEALAKRNRRTKRQMIQSYNVGLSGSFSKRKRIKKLRARYWKKWQRARKTFI